MGPSCRLVSFAEGRGNLCCIILHQRNITLYTLDAAFRIELPQGNTQVLAQTTQSGFRQLRFNEHGAELVSADLPLKGLDRARAWLFPRSRFEDRHHVEAIGFSKVGKGHMKRGNVTPWEICQQATYLGIGTAQLLLIGAGTLLIGCLSFWIELSKDLRNGLYHTYGVRNGQPVVRIDGIRRRGMRLGMSCPMGLT